MCDAGFIRNFQYEFPDVEDLFWIFSIPNISEWPIQVKYRHYNI